MKKIISLFAVSAMLLSSLTSVFASADYKVSEENKANPVIKGEFVAVDTDGTYQFDITYEAGTTLTTMVANKGKYTGTAINSFDATLAIDTTIWDVSEPDNMVYTDASVGVVPSATCAFNKLDNKIVFTWSSSAPNAYVSSESGKLYTIWLTPKDTSLDGNKVAMEFSTALIQIETQTSGSITNQTEYSNLGSADYAITTKFGPDAPVVDKEFDTANTTINSTGAVEGKYEGKILKHIATVLDKSALTKKISIKNESTGETRVSGRTIAQTLGGIGVDGATVTGTIAIGVLTDTDAVFTFSLVD